MIRGRTQPLTLPSRHDLGWGGPLGGRLEVRVVPGGHNLPLVGQWSVNVRVKNGAGLAWNCPSYQMQKDTDGNDLVLKSSAEKVKPDRDLALSLIDNAAGASDAPVRFSSATHEGARYLMLRYRPSLAKASALREFRATRPKSALFWICRTPKGDHDHAEEHRIRFRRPGPES